MGIMMFRKHITMVAAVGMAGLLTLTACGGGGSDAPKESQKRGTPTAGAAQQFSFQSGTAKANQAPPKTGDWANKPGKRASSPAALKWVQLSASTAGALNPVVTNGSGFTLYRFDKDTAQPSASNCEGECAVTWPPVVVARGGKVFVDGVAPAAVGTVKRGDGSLQLTIGGWPIYRFSKDLRPGDTNGQGVGGTWFGVTPDGQKAGAGAQQGGEGAGNTQAPVDGQKASSALLFDDKNFPDSGAVQSVSGSGCQNVARKGVTSSLRADGSMKIWSEPNCTGRSQVINGDVADLSTIEFDDAIASVFFD
jgi:predicted lipoprotein with Yx(FWY)xxD motif